MKRPAEEKAMPMQMPSVSSYHQFQQITAHDSITSPLPPALLFRSFLPTSRIGLGVPPLLVLLLWSFIPTLRIGLDAPPLPALLLLLLEPFPAGLIMGLGGRPQIPAPPGRNALPPLKPAGGQGANWLGFAGNPPGKNGGCCCCWSAAAAARKPRFWSCWAWPRSCSARKGFAAAAAAMGLAAAARLGTVGGKAGCMGVPGRWGGPGSPPGRARWCWLGLGWGGWKGRMAATAFLVGEEVAAAVQWGIGF